MSVFDTVLDVVFLLLLAGVGACFLVVGSCLVFGVWKGGKESSASAEGRVVGHETSEDHEGIYYAPLVEFEAGGRVHTIKGKFALCGRPEHKIGKRLTVFFPPGEPEKGQLGRWEGWWLAGTVFVCGLGFT